MLRVRLVCLVSFFGLAACGDDGGDVPAVDGGPDASDVDAAVDAPSCDRTRANPCPLPGYPTKAPTYWQGSGRIAALAEEVWTFDPPTTTTWRLSGTSSSGAMQFSISADVSLVCNATGAYCTAGTPCSGVNVDLVAGTTYYVKACNQVDAGDIPYNVFMGLAE
jgi:hypothetical protein